MLRIRSKRLLSGVSAIAMIAGGGVALADPTYTGPGLFTPSITNDQTATVTITADAVIDDDVNGVSFFNNLNMSGAGDKLAVDDSTLLGGIRNDGTMLSTDEDGIDIRNDSIIVANGILNNGLIQGGTGDSGIEVTDSVLLGNIVNAATARIIGDADGIFFNGKTVVVGNISNSGTISGTNAADGDGIAMNGTDLDFVGNITNNAGGTITANGISGAAIEISGTSSFVGNILNNGVMNGANGASGIFLMNTTFTGNITNNGSIGGAGSTIAPAININTGVTFVGSITNNGTLTATTAGNDAVVITGATTITGDFANNVNGLIQAADVGVSINNTTFTGNFGNSGRIISSTGDGVIIGNNLFQGNFTNNSGGTIQANNTGVLFNGATFTGQFLNSGLIDATGTGAGLIVGVTTAFNGSITNGGTIHSNNGLAVNVNGAGTVTGNFVNNGLIDSDDDDGVHISNATFIGNFINNSTGTIRAWSTAVAIQAATFTGDFTNHGLIEATLLSDAVVISSTTFTGNFTNDGSILSDDNAVIFSGTTFTGDVLNDGYLSGGGDTLRVNSGVTISGSITNGGETGVIISTGQDAIDINGIVNGIENFGTITGFRDGIDVDGRIGALLNSGTIIGLTEAAVDLSGADTATTITQDGGLIRGRTAGGTILIALDLTNGQADTYNASGGTIDGNIEGDAGDDVNVTNALVYLRGTATNLTDITKTGVGTFLLGAASRGDTIGEGVTVGGLNMFHNAGRLYVDDDTTVNMSNQYNQAAGTILEFYLTSDTATHGQINAGGEGLFLDGDIAAFVAGTTFGSVGGDTFTYNDVMTGGVSGTFDNAANIDTNSLFFTGEAIVNAADVDIVLHRESFADALILPGMSANETSVANVLDDIYALGPGAGGYGTDFAALFDYLLSLSAGDEALALAIYNELGGAEHAQLQQTTLDILNPFNTSMGQRLDAARTTQNGVGFASFGRQDQYAAASAIMSDAAPGVARNGAGVSLWARGYGQMLNVDGDPEAPGYDQDTGGAMGGVDFMVGRASIVGFAGGWSTTNVDFNTPGDSADVDSWQIGAYGSTGFGRFYLDAEIAGAFHDLTTTRFLNLPNPPGGTVAGANYDARSLSAAAEFGAVWRSGNWLFQPNAGFTFTDVDTDTFIESGAGDFNLIVNGTDAQSLASNLGARIATQFKAGGMNIIPEISASWRHEFEDDRQSFTAAFPDDPASTFNIVSSTISEDSALVGAGVTAGVTRSVELFINYNGLLNSDIDVHNGSAGLRATW